MKEKCRKCLVVSMGLILLFPILFAYPARAQSQKGPRSGMLNIVFYATPDGAFRALQAGEIDVMAWPISASNYDVAIHDPNILLTPSTQTYFMYGFNFNANLTIKEYGITWSPLSNETFRKALACLVDKNQIINGILGGQAERIDVPIPASQSNWWNTSVTYPNYPYEYDWQKAAQLLDSAGFRDIESNGKRNYPSDWNIKAGTDLDTIVLVVDYFDEARKAIAGLLASQMGGIGIPVTIYYLFENEIHARVMMEHNYHIYIGSQMVNHLPVYLAILAVSTFINPSFGDQWVYPNLWKAWTQMFGILEQEGLPDLYQEIWQSPTVEDAKRLGKRVQGRQTEGAFEVPICSLKSYFAYRKNIAGLVNKAGYGLDNPYSFLNAYRTDNPTQPVRVGLPWGPSKLNILYSIALQDYGVLRQNIRWADPT